ncbi:hypothetical protein [Streptomyces mirabilis]|uniref:hypothetical protein n=1 Tax=Streptomyces mirabilis TaxID=68239 RepID=UPI002255D317|nr:hypothetical protein [Streptomyces mirabilis]MCX4427100.1 hypothetical protein [Streptomyces mirabilis]
MVAHQLLGDEALYSAGGRCGTSFRLAYVNAYDDRSDGVDQPHFGRRGSRCRRLRIPPVEHLAQAPNGVLYRRFALALKALVHLENSSTAWTEFGAYASAGQHHAQ